MNQTTLKKYGNIYYVWINMKSRCQNPNVKAYKDYGGRGIGVCDSWQKFINFYRDMKDGYRKGLTLDRIDNSEGYFKENCRWVTMKENQNNRRNNKLITYQKKSLTITEWAKRVGIKRSTISMRYYMYGWSVSDCLSRKAYYG